MRYFIGFLLTGLMAFPAFSQHADHHHESPSPPTVPIRFIPNQKQWPAEVRYRAEIPGGHLYLENMGWKYVFYDQEAIRKAHASPQARQNDRLRGHSLSVKMLGASPRAQIRATQPGAEKYNFFLGKDPQQWAGNLNAFRQISYYNIYPGINLRLLPNEQTLKYEFEILPYAESRAIVFLYEGADRIFLQEGNLHLQTSLGEIIEKKPYCYQLIEGQKKEVPSQFLLSGQEVRFHFPEGYDRSQPLIIDPELVFSTYSGSVSDNWGSTATFDDEGNLYSGGIAFGAGFPTTSGAFDLSFGGGFDVGILKFSADGTELLYATYLGGNDAEFPHSMVVDNQNNLIILGTTSSLNFPITSGAFQTSFAGGQPFQPLSGLTFSFGSDLFISKLNASGNALLGSTFLGGNTNDGINVSAEAGILNYGDQFRGEIIVDANNDIYIASTTTSANFPVVNAVQGNRRGSQDGVVCKLNPNLTSLLWSTFLGGGAFDAAYSLKINPVNNDLYIAGPTRSNDLRSIVPTTAPVPFRATWSGNDDGYIARFTTTGQLVQITYLGTTANDQVYFLDFDPEGNPHAVGLTFGTYPVSPGVYSNPNSGQFIDKLNENLTERFFSTVVGTGQGGPDITITAVLVNDCGNIYLAGWGSSSVSGGNLSTFGLPVTADAYKSSTDGQDFYLMILEKDAQSLLYATFFGEDGGFSGDHVDGGTSRFSKDGVIYHAVCASCGSTDGFPTTPGAWSATNNSPNCNNAAFKFDIGRLVADFDVLDAALDISVDKGCTFPYTAKLRFEGQGATTWTWRIDGVVIGNAPEIQYTFPTNGVYNITLTVGNPSSCLQEITVGPVPFPVSGLSASAAPFDNRLCQGESAQLDVTVTATNPYTFTWTPTTGLSNPNILNPIVSPMASTTYVLNVVDDIGCTASFNFPIEVVPDLSDDFELVNDFGLEVERDCVPTEITFTYETSMVDNPTWTWQIDGQVGNFANQSGFTIAYDQEGVYNVVLNVSRGGECAQQITINKSFILGILEVAASPDTTLCFGESVQLNAQASEPGVNFQWSPTTGLSNPTIPNPVASPTQTTTYTVRITDGSACVKEETVLVAVRPEIVLDYTLLLGSDCGKPTTMSFENKSEGALNYEWSIFDDAGNLLNGSFQSGETPVPYTFAENEVGTYQVRLRAFNARCEEILLQTVEVENNLVFPPNVITPGLEDGKNDTFQITDFRKNYRFQVYNRWGGLMYESDNYQDEWGKEVEAGVYYYLLTSPAGVECRGWIEVIR